MLRIKKTACLLLLLAASTLALAQGGVDVLYLKTGSTIRGTALEVGDSVRMHTTDGSIHTYATGDIEKLTKETAPLSQPKRSVYVYTPDGKEVYPPTNKPTSSSKGFTRLYFGPALGVSIPVGTFANKGNQFTAAEAGVYIGWMNFCYFFTKQLGIHAKITMGFNDYTNSDPFGYYYNHSESYQRFSEPPTDGLWVHTGLLVGPLLSRQLGQRFHFDVRPSLGITMVSCPFYPVDKDFYSYNPNDRSFLAIGLGSSLRFDMSEALGLLLNLDYLNIHSRSGILPYSIQTVNISLGFIVKRRSSKPDN